MERGILDFGKHRSTYLRSVNNNNRKRLNDIWAMKWIVRCKLLIVCSKEVSKVKQLLTVSLTMFLCICAAGVVPPGDEDEAEGLVEKANGEVQSRGGPGLRRSGQVSSSSQKERSIKT